MWSVSTGGQNKVWQMTEPITNLCIVSDIYRCPPKYELVSVNIYVLTLLNWHHNMIKFPLLPRDSWLGDRKVIWPVKKLVWKFWCGTNGRRRPTGWIWKMAEKIDMGWYRLKIVSAFNEICNFFYHYVMYGYNRSTRCFWPLWRVAGKRILLVCAWLQLLRSYDKKEDCDLWKDGMFRAKNLRYICISRDPEVNTFVCHHLICFYDHAHT